MRYIRTRDGRIVNIQKFIDEQKDTPYYYDFEFDEIKNEENSCVLNWTAVGSRENSIKEQVGKRCQFGATIDSPFVAQSDSLDDLVDVFVLKDKCSFTPSGFRYRFASRERGFTSLLQVLAEHTCDADTEVYGAIGTDKGLIYVTKMNKEKELELCYLC